MRNPTPLPLLPFLVARMVAALVKLLSPSALPALNKTPIASPSLALPLAVGLMDPLLVSVLPLVSGAKPSAVPPSTLAPLSTVAATGVSAGASNPSESVPEQVTTPADSVQSACAGVAIIRRGAMIAAEHSKRARSRGIARPLLRMPARRCFPGRPYAELTARQRNSHKVHSPLAGGTSAQTREFGGRTFP